MKKYIIALLGMIIIASCDQDLLDIEQKSALSVDTYYAKATAKEAESLIASIYDTYYSTMNGVSQILFLDMLSDDHYAGGASFSDQGSNFQEASNLIITSMASPLKTEYNTCYQIIYNCNLILEKIPQTADEKINRVKAEANFFRALCMFELVRWFGTPPLVDHVLKNESEYNAPNTDAKTTIEWCLARMQEAADALPPIPGLGQQRTYGARISKHAALAYKGKVALWYGTRYKDQAILSQAVEPLRTVINSNLYGLLSDMFQIDRPIADFSKEYVFEHNSADANGYSLDQADIRQTWLGLRAENMTVPSDLEPLAWGWDPPTGEFGRFLEAHEGGIEKPRFKSTIKTYEQILAMSYAGSSTPPGIFNNITACEGYFRARQLNYKADVYTDIQRAYKYSKANYHYMRYAEVLLMYAEAKFLVDGDADGTGLHALNEVRLRAELTPLGALDYQSIKDERRAEMWQEHERFFDLVRWGDAATALKDKGKTWYVFYGYKAGTTEWDIRTRTGTGSGWSDKYNLLPFPYEQLSVNTNLIQNSDW
ncbi:MAG TPA: RagB/SusD family nutrient uptake outer membrane protein [Bacteroidales bacterium]|nr:RagB/SusD family nutrient uptake outer membrane protein [Bacteroidales bacterium]